MNDVPRCTVAAPMNAAEIKRRLRTRADASRVPVLQSFFKTGTGQYGDGDEFIGVTVPALRETCRECRGASLADIRALLGSSVHEERLLALLLLVDAFTRGNSGERQGIYDFYLAHTSRINNWDLVDSSAPAIVGGWLYDRSRAPLRALAKSPLLWERRIAIVATAYFIRRGEFDDTLTIARLLLRDRHDLIHKAVGWMLREVGKKDGAAERRFLDTHASEMPRTMLRYAIERFPPAERHAYLRHGREPGAGKSRHPPGSTSTRSAGASMKVSSPRKSSGAKR
jgi:3-methyladenine DNA glycosylase AlkD